MPIIKAETLGWTNYSVMLADQGGAEANDGFLTVPEANGHVAALRAERNRRAQEGATETSMLEIQWQVTDAEKLLADVKGAAAYSSEVQVQYLPDNLVNLPLNLRKRATELLINDDTERTGAIDTFVVDHARSRYDAINGITPGALSMKEKALNEIGQIAHYLGLD